MKTVKKRSGCPISSALDILGDKWSLLIIRDIAFSGKKTYNDFLRSEEGIATNILADRLSWLETAGILLKEAMPENRRSTRYRLTPKGVDLVPTLLEMMVWSDKYLSIRPESREFILTLQKNKGKKQLIKKIRTELLVAGENPSP